MLNRAVVVMAGAALILTVATFAVPRHVAGQVFGGYADSLDFSIVPQDGAVAAVAGGDIDMYLIALDSVANKQEARDDPTITVNEAFSGSWSILVNPTAPSDGTFNPFTIREIREAQHWAYDREFLLKLAGSSAIAMWTAYFRGKPDYARDAAFFLALEAQYSHHPDRARTQVHDAMSQVPGAAFDQATNKWLMDGAEIEIIIIQHVEDFRFEIGNYLATVIESWGFTPVLKPSTVAEALTVVYFSDPRLGLWHMYTEGWDADGWIRYDDSRAPFFYNWFWYYTPPPSLSIPCQTLNDGLYATADERRELLRACVTEGMREGVRVFLQAHTDVHVYRDALSNTAFDLFSGNSQPFAVRTTIKNGQPGGILNIGQPVHTGSAWNIYGGFRDPYSRNQAYSITDFGTFPHPHLGVVIPIRADFRINNVGPLGTHDVPFSAWTFDVGSNSFVNVPPGVTSGAYVDFDMLFGEWHHGEAITMTDVVAHVAMLSRMASGDLATANPNNAAQIYLTRWDTSFKGFEVLDADTIRIWYDTYSPDESLIAKRAEVFPWYPWELNAIITESVLAGETVLDDTSALLLGSVPLDLAKGETLRLFDPRLDAHKTANTVPDFLSAWVTASEATARWAALDRWRNDPAGCINGPSVWTCNYMVSQGPYFLDQYFTAPEGALYTAKRTGYPIEQDAWDFLGEIRVPELLLGTPPEVIQTVPATFQFTTTLDGAPYDRLATAAWILWDPVSNRIPARGDAIHSGPGAWDIELTADVTAVLGEVTLELWVMVVGEEATVPVLQRQSFTTISLGSAVIRDVSQVLDAVLDDLGALLEVNNRAIGDALEAVDARVANLANLVSIVLTVALVAVGIAVVALGTLLVVSRQAPKA